MAEPALSTGAGAGDPAVTTATDDFTGRFSPFAQPQDDGLQHLAMAVEGVNCAACIQKIESALAREPEIRQARVNFSTKRLNLAWQGDAARADSYARIVTGLGYRVQPFEAARALSTAEQESRFLLLCMAVAGFASGNIMLLSFALWSTSMADMGVMTRDLMHWISGLIAIPTVIFSGRPFFRSALAVLKNGRTNMDVPISVGVILTTVMSLLQTLWKEEHAYFDSVVMLIFFLLIGRYLDHRARASARSAASDLLALMAGTANVQQEDGSFKPVPIRDLREGMIIQVAMGERIPADALVQQGRSSLDTSLVTGESLPQPIGVGDMALSGMLNLDAPLRLQVARAADNSLLADIVRLMEKAEQAQSRYVRLADKVARLYTPVVHFLALLTFLGWTLGAGMNWQPALMIAVAVLIITCPCAIGLAVPVVQVLATSHLMKRGVMVKTGDAFERLATIDTLLCDKTGSLTLGHPELLRAESYAADDLQLAASLAAHSRHPLAKAMGRAYTGTLLPLEVIEHPGQGLSAQLNGQTVRLGSRSWCGQVDAPASAELELWLARDGLTRDGLTPVRFALGDQLRPDAAEVVAALRQRGIAIELLSGDRAEVVADVAARLGIEKWQGGMKPADKYARLAELHAQGRKVGMLGDGLNDAPVLAGADVSISPATAIDMAQNAADIVFMGDKLSPLLTALATARMSQKLVWENIMLSVIYNVVTVPLAMAGVVTPLVAALAMSGSSILVIANSFRLKRVR